MIELRQLRYFLVVAEEENFRKAGIRLHVDQSVLSRQIQGLEDQLELALFTRLPRGIRLTAAGRKYADEVRSVFTQLELAKEQAKSITRGQSGTLDIGISEICTHYPVVTETLRRFGNMYPDISLNLKVLSSSQQLDAFEKGKLDASFFSGPPQDRHRLHAVELAKDRIMVAVPRGHRLFPSKVIRLAQLQSEFFIQLTMPSGAMTESLQKRGFTQKIRLTVASLDALLSLLSAGLGIAFLAESLQNRCPHNVILKNVIDYSTFLSLHFVTRLDHTTPALDRFKQVLNEVGKEEGDSKIK